MVATVCHKMYKTTRRNRVAPAFMWTVIILGTIFYKEGQCGVNQLVNGRKLYIGNGEGHTSLPADIDPGVETIYLRDNLIETLTSFPDFVNLTQIYLADNILERFPNFGAVSRGLETLDVSNNHMQHIPQSLLESMENIKYLTLSGNFFFTFPEVKNPTGSLIALFLAKNYLNAIPRLSTFGRNLEKLILANNSIHHVTSGDFSGLDRLRILDLSGNGLKCFPDLRHVGKTLNVLKVERCGLSRIYAFELKHLDVLKMLSTPHNVLVEVPDFRQSPARFTLQYLYLQNNRISRVRSLHLMDMGSLLTLNLANNWIQQMPNLCHLSRLTFTLDLSLNPLRCDCRARWLKECHGQGMFLWFGSKCAGPPPLAGVSLNGIDKADLVCSKPGNLKFK